MRRASKDLINNNSKIKELYRLVSFDFVKEVDIYTDNSMVFLIPEEEKPIKFITACAPHKYYTCPKCKYSTLVTYNNIIVGNKCKYCDTKLWDKNLFEKDNEPITKDLVVL